MVDADGRIVGDVHAVDTHEFAASVGGKRRRSHDRNGEFDAGHGGGSRCDILWEERALAGCDLERSATSHRIDDLHERGQHRTIHDIDGAHERDAPCERDEGEGKATNVAAEETERQAKTGRPHSRRPG